MKAEFSLKNLEQVEIALNSAIQDIKSESELTEFNKIWLANDGSIKALFKELRAVPPADKPAVAASLNKLQKNAQTFFDQKQDFFKQQKLNETLSSQFCDLSLPVSFAGIGKLHPITIMERKVTAILKQFGCELVDGPEVETEYYCFDALNIPPHHPARDMQDTFFTDTGHVLRTHTTSVQARVLKAGGLPIKVVSAGRVYRNETEDASHQAMFHQYELIWLEKGLTLANLMAVMELIAKGIYGKRRKIRFVPKFYPYVEPGLGLGIACSLCSGAGCSMCGGAGWVTVVGAGMIHRNVLKEFGYNPGEVTGFAFGFGTTRLAAQEYEIPRGKMLYENDLRLFRQLP